MAQAKTTQSLLDIKTLMGISMDEAPETQHEDAYAPAGTGASLIGPAIGHGGGVHRRSAPPRSADTPAAVPEAPVEDAINPSHYRKHPSGIECIEVTRHMNFNVGNAIKYLWRYMDKNDPIENLKKAQWYIDDEIRRLEGLR